MKTTISFKNFSLPSPRWFRLTKKILSWSTTLTLAICMIYIPEDSKTLLVLKLVQSSTMEFLDSLLADEQPNPLK
jgi:hypothetical protein